MSSINQDISLQFPNNFFKEEIRNDYVVTVQNKKIWAVELDLLNEFIRVCRKHDIKFFAAGGTILGAVRHKGFIPWDDDIDLMMFRDEYNHLCKIATKEFKHPYFFQTEETDSGSYRGHAQLRNSKTTGILREELYQKRSINQGIFIDIFPLDVAPDDYNERQEFYKELRHIRQMMGQYISLCFPFKFRFRKNIYCLFINIFRHLTTSSFNARQKANFYYRQYEQTLQAQNKNSETVFMAPFAAERFTYKKSDLMECVSMPFEMLTIPVPANFDEILRQTYGNWKKFVVGGSVHGGIIFDTDRPYTEYFK